MAEDVFGIVGTTQGGSFRVERAVAEGGFSVVYRAQHGAFRAPVALKCLKIPGEITPDQRETFLEKFREEAEILFRLSASIPEVVRPLHVDTLTLRDGRFVPFLALEWLDGEALDEIINRRRQEGQAPMSAVKLVKLLRPLVRALASAHRFPGPEGMLTIVHRDIKPENILVASVNGRESVKILDFGISIARRAAAGNVGTAAEPVVDTMNSFTPRYGAPEQWDPEAYGEPGSWTDVWGLAMTMSEALTGHAVVDGDLEQMRATVFDAKRRPTPRSQGVVLSDAVEAVFQAALTIAPRDRTQDMESFWTPLETALGLPLTFSRRDVREETSRLRFQRGDLRMAESEPAPSPSSADSLPLQFELSGPVSAPRPMQDALAGPDEHAFAGGLSFGGAARFDSVELGATDVLGGQPSPLLQAPPSSGRAVLPAADDSAFGPVGAEPLSARGRLPSRGDFEEIDFAPPPSSPGAGLSRDLPSSASDVEPSPASRRRVVPMGGPRAPQTPRRDALEQGSGQTPRGAALERPSGSAGYVGGPESARKRDGAAEGTEKNRAPLAPVAIPAAARGVAEIASPRRPSSAPEGRNVGQVIGFPIGLIVLGLAVLALDRSGSVEAFADSPIRPTWVALGLLILGVGLFFWRLLAPDSER